MKTWHILAATAWVALFLWLARTAAELRSVPHASFEEGVMFTLVTALLWCITMPVAVGAFFACIRAKYDDGPADRAGCLGILAATAVVGAAIWVFCWMGAG